MQTQEALAREATRLKNEPRINRTREASDRERARENVARMNAITFEIVMSCNLHGFKISLTQLLVFC